MPAYSGNAYIEINGNLPCFTDNKLSSEFFEYHADLDFRQMQCMRGEYRAGYYVYREGNAIPYWVIWKWKQMTL